MQPHPLIHTELVRQREIELRRSQRHVRPPAQHELVTVVRAATSGDQTAWRSLVERFTPTLRNVARGYRLGSADVDDVVQTVWASAFSNIEGLRDPEAVAGWLCVITRREAVRVLERRRREVLVDEPCFADGHDLRTPESALLESEQRRAVVGAVGRLAGRQRAVVGALMRDDGLTYEEVSKKLGLPVGSIGPTRERAFARLRRDRRLTVTLAHQGREPLS
jgi:RNA polymerase sigma factor (sigma-70 family)